MIDYAILKTDQVYQNQKILDFLSIVYLQIK